MKNKLFKIFAIYALPILVGIIIFRYLQSFDDVHIKSQFLIHFLLLNLISLGFFSINFLLLLSPSKNFKWIYLFVCFFYYFFFFVTYLAASFGKIGWGQPLTYKMLFELLPILPTMFLGLPLANWIKYLIILLVIILFLFLGYLALKTAKFIESVSKSDYLKNNKYKISTIIILIFWIIIGVNFSKIKSHLYAKEELITRMISPSNNISYSNWLNPHSEAEEIEKGKYNSEIKFKSKNVILIVVDDLRADKLGPYNSTFEQLTPFLTELQNSGRLHKLNDFYSSCADTYCGILSLLSSHKRENLSRNDFKINNLLSKVGYKTNFIISSDHSSWYGLRDLYGDDVNYYFDGSMTDDLNNSANDQIVLDQIIGLPKYSGKPNFFYFHLMSPHPLGAKNERYKIYKPNKFGEGFGWFWGNQNPNKKFSKLDSTLVTNNYLNGVYQLDHYIKAMYYYLNYKGYLKNSIFIITSDHGEALSEHNSFGHGKTLFQESIKVPLLLIGDLDNHQIVQKLGYHVDVAPSILDLLQLPKPKTWEGESIFREIQGDNFTFHQLGSNYGLIGNLDGQKYKLIRNKYSGEESLYNLSKDPKELVNLSNQSSIKKTQRFLSKVLTDSFNTLKK